MEGGWVLPTDAARSLLEHVPPLTEVRLEDIADTLHSSSSTSLTDLPKVHVSQIRDFLGSRFSEDVLEVEATHRGGGIYDLHAYLTT